MGWIGIGFDPRPNSMGGADIVLCRIYNDTATCIDSYAFDIGIPSFDSHIGGSDDISTIAMIQENGITSALFTRPIKATDAQFDRPIVVGKMRTIVAFQPVTNMWTYHGPTHSAEFHIDYFGEHPLEGSIPVGFIVFIAIVCSIGVFLSLASIVTVIIKPKYFIFQSPLFCIILLIGTLLGYAAVAIAMPLQSEVLCILQTWLFGLSFVLVFGALFARVTRVWRTVSNAMKLKEDPVTQPDLLKHVGFVVLVEVVYLAVWTGVDRPINTAFVSSNQRFTICYSRNAYWWAIFVAYKAISLIFGAFLAYRTRKYDKLYNESRGVAICLYVMLLDLIVMVPLGFGLSSIPLVVFVVWTTGISIPYLAVTVILFLRPIRLILRGAEPPSLRTASMTSSKTRSVAATRHSVDDNKKTAITIVSEDPESEVSEVSDVQEISDDLK
jgi:hypothetical protein